LGGGGRRKVREKKQLKLAGFVKHLPCYSGKGKHLLKDQKNFSIEKERIGGTMVIGKNDIPHNCPLYCGREKGLKKRRGGKWV